MYRTAPENEYDSGWAFLAGDESQEYMADASNHGIYEVNTITNYDPDVVRLLDAPVGSAFIREGTRFIVYPDGAPSE